MKKLFAITALSLLLLAGCANKTAQETTAPTATVPEMTTPVGQGQAVVPEEGDIVIPIGE